MSDWKVPTNIMIICIWGRSAEYLCSSSGWGKLSSFSTSSSLVHRMNQADDSQQAGENIFNVRNKQPLLLWGAACFNYQILPLSKAGVVLPVPGWWFTAASWIGNICDTDSDSEAAAFNNKVIGNRARKVDQNQKPWLHKSQIQEPNGRVEQEELYTTNSFLILLPARRFLNRSPAV